MGGEREREREGTMIESVCIHNIHRYIIIYVIYILYLIKYRASQKMSYLL